MEFEAYLEKLQADAEHHGSGVFSCDLNRMQRVLGAFQLASPEDYVLPVLAAAVLRGATWFRLEDSGGSTCLSWDGPALSLEQLQRLIPSIGSSGTPLAELAVALLAARQLGQVCLQSSHGRVLFRGPELVVDELAQEGPNTFTLRRPVWSRLLRRSLTTSRILQSRARFAPLQLTPRSTPERVKTKLVLTSGESRAEWLSADEWVDLPVGPWGTGVLYFGQADWQLVRHGVTYSMPSPFPGLVAVWWSDSLPLDLSRKELQRGPDFQAWLSWLHEQLATFILSRDLSEHLALLVRAGRHSQQPLFLETPLFRRVDGSLANLSQLREEYREHGWLPVVSRPMAVEWEPQRVVILEKPHEQQLREVFSNWLNLDHLENQTNLPRLPADEEYVVRMPFFQGRGEAGLRRYPHYHGFRQFIDGEWQEKRAMPLAVDAARESADSGVLPLGELYWTLKLMSLGDTFRHLRRLHFFMMLGWLRGHLAKVFQKQFSRKHPLEVLLDPKSQVQIQHSRGKIRSPQLKEIASGLKLDLRSGEEIPLVSLCQTGARRTFSVFCRQGPGEALLVDTFTAMMLRQLFLPGFVTESGRETGQAPQVTGTAQRLLTGVSGPGQLLGRLLEYQQCGAYKMLECAGLLEDFRQAVETSPDLRERSALDGLVQRAYEEMRSEERSLSTPYLLLSLADSCNLSSAGLPRSLLLPLLLEWGEFEFRQEMEELSSLLMDQPEGQLHCDLGLAWSYLRCEQFQAAREFAISRLSHGSRRRFGLLVLGLADSGSGDLEAGLVHFREASRLGTEPVFPTYVAETLMWLGRRDEARAACPVSDDRYTRMIRASLAESPEECLRLCDLVEQAPGSGQYFELHEMRGLSYWKLGQKKEAHHHLSRFLEARADNSMLDLRESRMEQARRIVKSLSGESIPPEA